MSFNDMKRHTTEELVDMTSWSYQKGFLACVRLLEKRIDLDASDSEAKPIVSDMCTWLYKMADEIRPIAEVNSRKLIQEHLAKKAKKIIV